MFVYFLFCSCFSFCHFFGSLAGTVGPVRPWLRPSVDRWTSWPFEFVPSSRHQHKFATRSDKDCSLLLQRWLTIWWPNTNHNATLLVWSECYLLTFVSACTVACDKWRRLACVCASCNYLARRQLFLCVLASGVGYSAVFFYDFSRVLNESEWFFFLVGSLFCEC